MKRLFTLGWVLVLLSCQSGGTENRLEAKISGVENGTKVFISELTKGYNSKIIDSAEVQNGKITTELPRVAIQTLNIMSIRGVNGNLQFINENKPITIDVDTDRIQDSEVKSGDANTLLKDYQKILAEGNDKVIQAADALSSEDMQDLAIQQNMRDLQLKIEQENSEFRKTAIEENPDLLPSLLMLFDMEQTQLVPQAEMKKLYDKLSPQLKDHFMGVEIGERLEQAVALGIGGKAPDFSAKTPEGEELSLNQALNKGEYTLVDFWAAWCMPCRKENPNIVKVYNKYKDDGFNVLGVSLDKSEEAWLKAIKDDGLTWDQISNLRFWQDPIAKRYNIRAIPASFIMDKEGTIVAKNVRGLALERKVKELLELEGE